LILNFQSQFDFYFSIAIEIRFQINQILLKNFKSDRSSDLEEEEKPSGFFERNFMRKR